MLVMKPILALEALDHEIINFFGIVRLLADTVDVEKSLVVDIFLIFVSFTGPLLGFDVHLDLNRL